MKKLYVVRHGETVAKTNKNAEGVLDPLVSGWLDTPLTEKGIGEMFAVGKKYKDIRFDAVFCSPLIRSRQSAKAFLEGAGQSDLYLQIVELPELLEINYGRHEGMSASEVDKEKKAFFGTDEGKAVDGLGYSFPGTHPEYGEQESFRVGADRYAQALKNLASSNDGQNILVISHSGVMRALQLCGKIQSAGAEIGKDLKFGEVILLESDGEKLDLVQ